MGFNITGTHVTPQAHTANVGFEVSLQVNRLGIDLYIVVTSAHIQVLTGSKVVRDRLNIFNKRVGVYRLIVTNGVYPKAVTIKQSRRLKRIAGNQGYLVFHGPFHGFAGFRVFVSSAHITNNVVLVVSIFITLITHLNTGSDERKEV